MRERELTGLNTLRSGRRTKEGLSDPRKELAGCRSAHHQRQEGGGGANLAPEMEPPTKLQTGFKFLTKDFLRFWIVDICWEGCS